MFKKYIFFIQFYLVLSIISRKQIKAPRQQINYLSNRSLPINIQTILHKLLKLYSCQLCTQISKFKQLYAKFKRDKK